MTHRIMTYILVFLLHCYDPFTSLLTRIPKPSPSLFLHSETKVWRFRYLIRILTFKSHTVKFIQYISISWFSQFYQRTSYLTSVLHTFLRYKKIHSVHVAKLSNLYILKHLDKLTYARTYWLFYKILIFDVLNKYLLICID